MRRSCLPWGALVAAVLAAGIVTAPPWRHHDEAIAARVRALAAPDPATVAVVADPAHAPALVDLARRAGAAEVAGPSTGPVAPAAGLVREVDGRALLDGRAPASLLAGQIVVVDVPVRARARAAEAAGLAVTSVTGAEVAVVAALAALVVALGAARARRRSAVAIGAGAIVLAAGAGAAAALAGRAVPILELCLAAPVAVVAGRVDAGRALERAWDDMVAPLYRAAAPLVPTASADDLVGPGLAERLDARALLLLTVAPGARRLTPGAGWRLRAADLLPHAPLDPRRPPFRDAGGLARASSAAALLDEPGARLLPLRAAGGVVGWLLVVPAGDEPALERLPATAAAVSDALGALIGAARLRRTRAEGAASVRAAAALEQAVATVEAAAARTHVGLLLASPAGVTRWKNPRADELLGGATGGGDDLARVLHLVRHAGEPPSAALERLLRAEEPIRCAAPEHALVVTITPLRPPSGGPPGALLVELVPVDAVVASALRPDRPAASAGSSSAVLRVT